jgi:hypothetical protein
MAEGSCAWLRQVNCRSTDTSTSACDVANARLHEKGKGPNGILFFLECAVRGGLHWVLLLLLLS